MLCSNNLRKKLWIQTKQISMERSIKWGPKTRLTIRQIIYRIQKSQASAGNETSLTRKAISLI